MPDDETVPPSDPPSDPSSDPSFHPPADPPAESQPTDPPPAARPPAAPSRSATPSIRRPHPSQHTPKDAKGRFLRKDGTFTPAASRPRAKRRRQPTRVKHFRVDRVLTDPAQRAEYDRLLADPNTTTAALMQWLHARGHSVCQGAVQAHRRHAQLHLYQLRECSHMASMFCTLGREHGAGAIAGATRGSFEMELMMDLFKMHQGGKAARSPRWWNQMSRTLAGMIATRRSLEAMRADFEAKARAAVEAVKTLDSRERGREIAERVKQILGA